MKLLVSVVDEQEAKFAAEGGADIVDVKNPLEGALGANFPHVIRGVRKCIPSSLPVSVAIGDSPNKPGAAALAALGAAVCNIQYVKVGLYGTSQPGQAVYLLKEVCRAVRGYDPAIKIIAAAYADAHRVGALPPLESPAVSSEAEANGCMLDTFVKDGSSLFMHLDNAMLHAFVNDCRERNLLSALAGSLTEEDIPRISAIGPEIIGFRTAACDGDRIKGRITPGQVDRLKQLITANSSIRSL